ncbi:hypothetical protein TVAG_157510 [Trichomonas vaginalis G3]|uniref:EF hand family protein n=1 Tax=Trichomonas vaginalis (strain ATCC PRA-98 / G3) TaxID=412133 RepID=A2E9M3_TRIV3|nr:EF-Hand calcium-binding domain-containing protein 6-related family [Trichomonas vaginalis G3]EAY10674.1 hypothetical protein TVAG_157510 [Trichomonas vaginalis G3]KAI5512184.1 EF-Hand calcium-binding domain-containing protein 6-related family [Trichomonas vaginalis G3]|eukprot:XP_001322897.1 hypothetical protein [Trichomonas vaginalis G3]
MCAQILPKLKNYCTTRGIDIPYELEYLDRKRTGFLNELTFRKFFSNIGYPINDQQFKDIVAANTTEKGIEIAKFISSIENSQDQESQQALDIAPIYPELKRLKGYLQTNNTTLREIFRRADPSCRGYVSENAFFHELGYSTDAKKIAAAFTFDKYEGVRYSLIERELNNLQLTTTKVKPDLSKLAESFEFNGIDMNNVFNQYDRYKTGRIPVEAFNAVIRNFSRDSQPIIEYYASPDGSVDIRQFSQDINMTTQTIRSTPKVVTRQVRQVDIDELVSYLKGELRSRHVRMSDFFGDLQHEELVKPQHFQGILNTAGLTISQDEVVALSQKFMNERGLVQLQPFLALFNDAPTQRIPEINVKGLREYLNFSSRRLLPLLQRQDPQRTGEVDIGVLSTILTRSGYAMNRMELEGIKRAFAGRLSPTSIKYEELCMAVDPEIPKQQPKEEPKVEKKQRELTPELMNLLKKANNAYKRNGVCALDEFRIVDMRQTGILTAREISDAVQCAEFTPQEFNKFLSYYPDHKYMDMVRDLQRDEVKADENDQPQKQQYDDNFVQKLAVLKGDLEVRSLTVADVLGARYVPVQRAIGLLAKYTDDAPMICQAFIDRKRPELVDTAVFSREIEKIPAKKKAVTRDDAGAIYRDLGELRAKFEARHCNPRRAFAGKPPKISYDELMDALRSLNIILDGRARFRIREHFEINGEVDWNNFIEEIEKSTTLAF